jgi:hypothetical protein
MHSLRTASPPQLTGPRVSSYGFCMKDSRHRHMVGAVALIAVSLVAGCAAPAPQQPPPAASAYRPVATIREVMNSVIDPSVDVVWNAVSSVVDDGRLTEQAPATDEAWTEVRRHALIVSEAANLLLMPDRPVAAPGAPSLAPGVELTPEEIRALIDKNRDGWDFYVRQLQDSLTPALAAIEAKNPQALFDAGEKIDETCENCHQVFWYPNAVAAAP